MALPTIHYDTTTENVQQPGYVSDATATSGLFTSSEAAGVATVEKPGVNRNPVTYKVKMNPVYMNRQQTYREDDLLFALNTRDTMSNDRHNVFNLQALNELLEERKREDIGIQQTLRDLESGVKKRRYSTSTELSPHLRDVPVKLYDVSQAQQGIDQISFLGVASADQTENVNYDGYRAGSIGQQQYGVFNRMFTVVGKHYCHVPPVFLNADGAYDNDDIQVGCQIGLRIGRVPRGFYDAFHRYDINMSDEEPTPESFLQVIPVFRHGKFPGALSHRRVRLHQQGPDYISVDNDNARFEELLTDSIVEQDVKVEFANGQIVTQKIPQVEHAMYYWIGTVVGTYGPKPVRADKKLAIRTRRGWDLMRSNQSYLEVQLNGSLHNGLPLAGY